MNWTNHRLALTAVVATISPHAVVMVVLLTAYQDVNAPDSIRAMAVRLVAWAVVLGLMVA